MIFDLSHSQWATQWQLYLQECAAWWRSNRTRNDQLERLIGRLESYYTYEPTRIELEQYMKHCKDPFILKVWNIMLLLCVCQNINDSDSDSDSNIKLQHHWVKIWSDHYFRIKNIKSVKIEWWELRELLLERGLFSQFYVLWIHLINSYGKLIVDNPINIKTMYSQVLIHKILVCISLTLQMIHPMVVCQPRMDAFHYLQRQQQYASISVSWDSIIPSPMIREQGRQTSLLLPLIHSKNILLSKTMVLMNKLNSIIIQLQTLKREYLQDYYVYKHSLNIISKMKSGSRYYSQRSSYTENFKDYYGLLKNQIKHNQKHLNHNLQYLNNILEDNSLFELFDWQLRIYKMVGWMPDNVFQNIGFTLIPNNRILFREDENSSKYIPDNYLLTVIDVFREMYKNVWGNINQRTSIYLFLSNSELKFFKDREGLFNDWLCDPRYCSSSNPLWNTTQSFNTNMRMLFHLMKMGWYPQETGSNFIYLIVQQLHYIKNKINSYSSLTSYQNNRLDIQTVYRRLRMTIDSDFNTINTKAHTFNSLINEQVIIDYTYQDFMCCLVHWIQNLVEIKQMSFLQLEEAVRECWNVMQDHYSYIEKTPDFQRLNIQASLRNNPVWSRAIISHLYQNKSLIDWWQLCADSDEEEDDDSDDEETLDAITRIRMENPVRLPSGSMVDRTTYTMLLQTSGKDPFTMVDLPSLGS